MEPVESLMASPAIGENTAGPSITTIPPDARNSSMRPFRSSSGFEGRGPRRVIRPSLVSAQMDSKAAMRLANTAERSGD
jgi:hypothetical protein